MTELHPRSGVAVSTVGLVHIYRAEGHDVAALSGVDLVVRPGEVVGLLGPSGAGKSTLLSLFAGLIRPSAGRIRVGDHDLGAMSPAELDRYRATDVGFLLQGAMRNLIPYLTPRENIAFAQRAALRAGRPDVPAPAALLDELGLGDVAEGTLRSLTPAQQQLTALGVALAARPGLLLADEPTSQLDHEARALVIGTLQRVSAEHGTTIIIVTHDPHVAEALPRTVTIRDGRVSGEGRRGEELSIVAVDGSLPLPQAVVAALPPGTLVRVQPTEHGWLLERDDIQTDQATGEHR